jgi:hypothetical protein
MLSAFTERRMVTRTLGHQDEIIGGSKAAMAAGIIWAEWGSDEVELVTLDDKDRLIVWSEVIDPEKHKEANHALTDAGLKFWDISYKSTDELFKHHPGAKMVWVGDHGSKPLATLWASHAFRGVSVSFAYEAWPPELRPFLFIIERALKEGSLPDDMCDVPDGLAEDDGTTVPF